MLFQILFAAFEVKYYVKCDIIFKYQVIVI